MHFSTLRLPGGNALSQSFTAGTTTCAALSGRTSPVRGVSVHMVPLCCFQEAPVTPSWSFRRLFGSEMCTVRFRQTRQ
ncbi:hypothetical protein TGRH88_064540 [Toxoplasma gondii]|uniref:Uncharacterized protein n=1 Tax=Toxoplasma gondii TaxID=5811 RepID=A0A7J6JUI4_TOXGO|nr:hypothetical protein TGRH88_064540 [Toxoplasma gondii]